VVIRVVKRGSLGWLIRWLFTYLFKCKKSKCKKVVPYGKSMIPFCGAPSCLSQQFGYLVVKV